MLSVRGAKTTLQVMMRVLLLHDSCDPVCAAGDPVCAAGDPGISKVHGQKSFCAC